MASYYCGKCNSSWSTARISPVDPEMRYRLCSECRDDKVWRLQAEVARLRQALTEILIDTSSDPKDVASRALED